MAFDVIVVVLLLLGVLMTCIPTMPGIFVMLLTTISYGLITHFERLEWWHFAIFVGIAVLSAAIDYSSGLIGAKFGGANRRSLLAGLLGLVLGLLLFPPFGSLLGLFVGVFAAELIQFNDHLKALKAASFSFAAIITGYLTNIFLALTYFVVFLILVF